MEGQSCYEGTEGLWRVRGVVVEQRVVEGQRGCGGTEGCGRTEGLWRGPRGCGGTERLWRDEWSGGTVSVPSLSVPPLAIVSWYVDSLSVVFCLLLL